jgi:hypothetical protein
MADISAIFFILLILGAQLRLEKTLSRTFWMGLLVVIALATPIATLLALPFGPAKFLGWILLATSLALSSIGSAGMAAHLADRLSQRSDVTALGAFVRGAVVLELAAFFPVIGWFFLWPLLLITAFGATAFALLNWLPREKAQASSATTSPSHA